ncbi:MAG: YdgA family protein [Bordetella sp.]|uniref:YdgA family protein n=1 Tax=Bordetella sp. TaxID=28081 RepID=UPI003F7BA461
MKKSAIAGGIAVVLVVGWLGGTWYTGKRLQAEAPERLAELNQRLVQVYPAYGMKIEQLSYVRGLFSSHARYGLTMVGKNRDASDPVLPAGVLQVDVTAYHGPFPLQALSHGIVGPRLAWVHSEIAQTDAAKALFAAAHGKTPVSSNIAFSYGGKTQSTLDVAPLDFTYKGHKIVFGGAQSHSKFNRATQDLQSTTEFASLSVDGTDLGGGQVSIQANPQSLAIDPLIWKTGKGEGRFMMTAKGQFPQNDPAQPADANTAKPTLDSLSAKLVLSKAMLNELTASYLVIAQGVSRQDADKAAPRQVNGVAGVGMMLGLIRDDGANLVTDVQYGKGKLSINGHERDAGELEQMLPGGGNSN